MDKQYMQTLPYMHNGPAPLVQKLPYAQGTGLPMQMQTLPYQQPQGQPGKGVDLNTFNAPSPNKAFSDRNIAAVVQALMGGKR